MENLPNHSTLTEPKVFECARSANGLFERQVDLNVVDVNRPETFSLPHECNELEVIVETLIPLLLPEELITRIINATNEYIEKRLHKHQRKSKITYSNIIQFFGTVYYIGVIHLPWKNDIWSTHSEIPTHTILVEGGMRRNRFKWKMSFICENDNSDEVISEHSDDEEA